MNRTQPIDYKSVLSLFLPAGLLDYFDITEASNMGDYFMLVLVEKDIVPENLQDLPLISNGFHKPITVTDFPVRDHTMYFRIKRRRWLDKSTGKSYSYNPQNEAFLHSRTSRAISQNETYRRNTPYPPLKNRPAYAGIHIL